MTGNIKNPYYPSVYNIGMIGDKYCSTTKEYGAWNRMLRRCFDNDTKNTHHTYDDVTCCSEWLLYDNFYEWLHSQENFDKWYNGKKWDLDKDILNKGNKIYAPENCCLVPSRVNCLFRGSSKKDDLPIGVQKHRKKYRVNSTKFPARNTTIEAFQDYKQYKENLIKQVAREEYENGNITKQCYEAMMRYEVEITD
jgi:hypothetical protein